jgi:preprotein translocase subunit SecF
MAIVVFIYFKSFAPSIAVVLAALSDIIITMSITNLMGMKLSTAGIAAFLMLIGYSVDTDILLTTKVVKAKDGDMFSNILGAMKTGMTMTITTLVAVTVALIVAESPQLIQIMTIILIGLSVDLINTWIQNVAIIRFYLEKRDKGEGK